MLHDLILYQLSLFYFLNTVLDSSSADVWNKKYKEINIKIIANVVMINANS